MSLHNNVVPAGLPSRNTCCFHRIAVSGVTTMAQTGRTRGPQPQWAKWGASGLKADYQSSHEAPRSACI